MKWICERCQGSNEAGFTIQIKARTDSDLVAHSVPAESSLCFDCALYLLWSRIFPDGIRKYWDEYYMSGNLCVLGRKSRYGSVSREFDINYGFLDSETNMYWDEKL